MLCQLSIIRQIRENLSLISLGVTLPTQFCLVAGGKVCGDFGGDLDLSIGITGKW